MYLNCLMLAWEQSAEDSSQGWNITTVKASNSQESAEENIWY